MSDRERLLRAIEDVRQRAEDMSPKPLPRLDRARIHDEVTVHLGRPRRTWPALALLSSASVLGLLGAGVLLGNQLMAGPARVLAARVEAARAAAPAPSVIAIRAPGVEAARKAPLVEEPGPTLPAEPSRSRGASDVPARTPRSNSPKPSPSWWW